MSKGRSPDAIIRGIKGRKTANDKIYTPKTIALKMIEICEIKETDKVLDQSKGGGVFYDNFPQCIKSYCEIDEGIDFFDYNNEVDVIVGNPPYSLWNKWLEKTISLNPKKICYIFGVWNLTQARLKNLKNNGYTIQKITFARVDWWMSSVFICLLEKKDSVENIEVIFDTVMCENCGKSGCRKNGSVNECKLLKKTGEIEQTTNIE